MTRKERSAALTKEIKALNKVLMEVQARLRRYEQRTKAVSHQHVSYYGDVVEKTKQDVQARYHWARYFITSQAICRRLAKKTKRLARVNKQVQKRKDEPTVVEEISQNMGGILGKNIFTSTSNSANNLINDYFSSSILYGNG